MMKMTSEKIRSEKLYRVGYLPGIDKYAIACVVTWVAWYDRFFEISEEEYNFFGTEELDKLALELNQQGSSSPRFLFSDKDEENNASQRATRKRAKGQ